MSVRLIGGPYDGADVVLTRCPPAILVGGRDRYEQIVDPVTRDFLGGYVYVVPQ